MKYVVKNVMKTGILLALVLLGTACTQNDELLQQPQGGRTYVVSMEQPTTSRATLTIDGTKATFQFEAGDEILITAKNTANDTYEAVAVTLTETEGTLGFTLPTGYDTPVQAVFGATTVIVNDADGAITRVSLPKAYTYTTEYPSDAHAVLYAEFPTDNSNTLEFQYLTGILGVTMDHVPAGVNQFKITRQGSNSENLNGSFELVDAGGGKKQIESTSLGLNEIVFNFPAATAGATSMTFYVPLPVDTYEGFEVNLYDTTISTPTSPFTMTTNTSNKYTIDRATLYTLPAVKVFYPLNVSTPSSLNADDLSKHITTNGTLAITGSINGTDLETLKTWLQGSTVPATLKTLDLSGTTGLTEIPTEFFYYRKGNDNYKGLPATLTGIYLPTDVTTISYSAFNGCTSLNTVSMPGVTEIGYNAFDGCTSLNTVSMPAAKTIGQYAFYGCTSLETVLMPAAETIGESAFGACSSLNTVSMPAAKTIGNSAFSLCTSLNTVSMPAAETIGEKAFWNCISLNAVSMPAAKTIDRYAFGNYLALESINLPAVTKLKANVFARCHALKEITFGDGASHTFTSVDSDVFYEYPFPAGAVLKLYGAADAVTVDVTNNKRTWKPVAGTDIDITLFSEVWLNDVKVYPVVTP